MKSSSQPGGRREPALLFLNGLLHAGLILLVAAVVAGCERPPIESTQAGYRGTGMADIQNPRTQADKAAANLIPAALPATGDAGGPTAGETYQNVEVLGDLSVGEFTRLMVAITNWVSPDEGCAYCHDPADMASEAKYPKIVSRRMIQMTQHINADWDAHVGQTGVTCYTCHRGEPVPAEIWFEEPDTTRARHAGNRAGQNAVAEQVGLASLPSDPFTPYLDEQAAIRVEGTEALPHGNRSSIKQAEWTYGLMMHFSKSLGVNCTHCHNSRHFSDWEQSPPARAQAWHGIQMVGALNRDFLIPLKDAYPPHRLGVLGDAPKANCATCHQAQNKPLGGAAMVADYPALQAGAATP